MKLSGILKKGEGFCFMTMEEKRQALDELCREYTMCSEGCPLAGDVCQCGRGKYFTKPVGASTYMTDDEINAAYAIAFPDEVLHIKDSGERREFDTGAVRDIQEGKGRCDLMPLDVVADILEDSVVFQIFVFTTTGDHTDLQTALNWVAGEMFKDRRTMFLEVAKHFEEGAKKYGENNWQKGIPVNCYINSAVRHYLKWLRGDKDEPHDRAFCWNIMCAIWTCKHKPELNPYGTNNAECHVCTMCDRCTDDGK